MKKFIPLLTIVTLTIVTFFLSACSQVIQQSTSEGIDWNKLSGQKATCDGPKSKVFLITIKEVQVDLGRGIKADVWTFNGALPSPTIEVCVGDKVLLQITNKGSVPHGLDTHAFKMDASKFGPILPGKILTIEATVDTPGVYMYHCAAGLDTDQHIKMSMSGVMIVYDNKELPPAKEISVLRGAIFGEPDSSGVIHSSVKHMEVNTPSFYLFNGRFDHKPLDVKAKGLVRAYFVNAGPCVASFHVIGTILDRVFVGGNPQNVIRGVQTFEVGSGNGAIIEFAIPEEGIFLLVDHDQLSHIRRGFVMPINGPK